MNEQLLPSNFAFIMTVSFSIGHLAFKYPSLLEMKHFIPKPSTNLSKEGVVLTIIPESRLATESIVFFACTKGC